MECPGNISDGVFCGPDGYIRSGPFHHGRDYLCVGYLTPASGVTLACGNPRHHRADPPAYIDPNAQPDPDATDPDTDDAQPDRRDSDYWYPDTDPYDWWYRDA